MHVTEIFTKCMMEMWSKCAEMSGDGTCEVWVLQIVVGIIFYDGDAILSAYTIYLLLAC